MAAIEIIGNQVAGIKYTWRTDNNDDWESVPNSTYFFNNNDQKVYFKNDSGVILDIYEEGGGSGVNLITITYSNLINLIDNNNLDLNSIYKLIDVGPTSSFCLNPESVINQGRGNVYLNPLSNSQINPYGTWEANFEYSAKWVMVLSEYEFNRTWLGRTINSMIFSVENPYAEIPEVPVNFVELLSQPVSMTGSLIDFANDLEISINGNSMSSGWHVWGWTISNNLILDYDNLDLDAIITDSDKFTFSTLQLLIENSASASLYFGTPISCDYGSGYTYPPFGIVGEPLLSTDFSGGFTNLLTNWFLPQGGLLSTTYSLPCIYDINTNDLIEVQDSWGNIWRGSPELGELGISSIFDYPIYLPSFLPGSSCFNNCKISSSYLNQYNVINSFFVNSDIDLLWLGSDLLSGSSIINSISKSNKIGSLALDGFNKSTFINCFFKKNTGNLMEIKDSIIFNSVIYDNISIYNSIIVNSNINTYISNNSRNSLFGEDNDLFIYNNLLNYSDMIIRDNMTINMGDEILKTSYNFNLPSHGKTFSLFKSSMPGHYSIGYQSTDSLSGDIELSIWRYEIDQSATYSQTLMFTASSSDLSNTIGTPVGGNIVYIPNNIKSWGLIMSFSEDVDVDKLTFDNTNKRFDLSTFHIYVRKTF
jgi:hypothetical protein